MKNVLLAFLTLASSPLVHADIAPEELVAPKLEISGGNLNFTIRPSVAGRTYQLQYSETMAEGTWRDMGAVRVGDGNNLMIVSPYLPSATLSFYRLLLSEEPPVYDGFSLIPAGTFQMGDQSNPLVGWSGELPVHTAFVSAFYMGKYEVTKEEWDGVRAWGLINGYTDLPVGIGKAADHPVNSIAWYDMVKWCNARSQKESLTPCYTVSEATYKTGDNDSVVCNWGGNGYRLPTDAEWEKAARGGVTGKNFPWGWDTISHSQANYVVYSSTGTTNFYSYDVTPRPPGSVTKYYHPTYATGNYPYTAPVDSFAPNAYGLFNMSGNVGEMCWDWYGPYSSASQTNPRGPTSGTNRVVRGGCWGYDANDSRAAMRFGIRLSPSGSDYFGFRVARSSIP